MDDNDVKRGNMRMAMKMKLREKNIEKIWKM